MTQKFVSRLLVSQPSHILIGILLISCQVYGRPKLCSLVIFDIRVHRDDRRSKFITHCFYSDRNSLNISSVYGLKIIVLPEAATDIILHTCTCNIIRLSYNIINIDASQGPECSLQFIHRN